MVRGICCLVPGIPGETENIEVRSIVGRYLEHSRIYVFGKGSTEKMYIASADFMTRNTRRRVEVGCPILDPNVRAKIWEVIHLQWSDNTKAMKLLPERKYEPVIGEGGVNSQEEQMKLAEEAPTYTTSTEEEPGQTNIATKRALHQQKKEPQKNLWQRIIHWGK